MCWTGSLCEGCVVAKITVFYKDVQLFSWQCDAADIRDLDAQVAAKARALGTSAEIYARSRMTGLADEGGLFDATPEQIQEQCPGITYCLLNEDAGEWGGTLRDLLPTHNVIVDIFQVGENQRIEIDIERA
jgi:hypothetical protein